MKGPTMTRTAWAGIFAGTLAAALTALAASAAPAQESPPVPEPPPATAPAENGGAPAGLAPSSTTLPTTLPTTLAGAAGTWDLSLEGGRRRCVLTLAMETGPSGRAARFPAGCRRALPLLAGIGGWLFTDEGLRLVDRNLRPVLAFARSPDGMSLGATAENGEHYNLVPLQIAAMQPPAAPGTATAAAAQGDPSPAAATEKPDEPPAPGPAPGLYALDRAEQKDLCRLEFALSLEAGKDTAPVRVLPDCRDSGITVFDPVSWRFANGHLTLKARRGHAVNLVAIGEGRWRRDPEIGAPLMLRKVEP
ncbi:AprI/Inh family metalloprotease inhibitor [Methylorubrum populi]|uniref:AprI/Inh family metalloprotease inhibitor n=1 Tax=Methylorubrum rhodesianum TaxID=29427 RepID=A0ABU9ZI33_9HYPH|nr:AprI/Inh family metalloprotease inhibitor [Methylorubrum rhodesianum]MBK3403883.1 AprI/Inh family metalloprotease inhibitor [Methylorubrum rhodesianum]MBY0143421.1 AprI/Inh family metalloprotease inhibitor [Methylorubrum populi]